MAQGPYAVCAAFCERTLEEKDNVLTLIRVVDQIRLTMIDLKNIDPKNLPKQPGRPLSLVYVLMVKSGDFKGTGKLRVVVTTPSGKELTPFSLDVTLEGEERGANVLVEGLPPAPLESGLYYYSAFFDDRMLTRTPLRVTLEGFEQQSKLPDAKTPAET